MDTESGSSRRPWAAVTRLLLVAFALALLYAVGASFRVFPTTLERGPCP